MYPRFVLVLLMGSLVIAAGCVDGIGSIDPDGLVDGDDAPAEDGADRAGGQDGADDGPGDGSTDDRSDGIVENRTAVLLDAGSYTATWQMEAAEDGEVVSVMSDTTAVDYENRRSSFGMLMESEGETENDFENYHADGMTYARYGSGEDATYNVMEAAFEPENTMYPVQSYVSEGDLEAFSAVGSETYDGVRVTRYERSEQPAWLGVQSVDEDFTWTQFNYAVLVDGDGLVRFESWGGDGVDDEGVHKSITFSYSLTGVGSTAVDEPAWVATARSESEQ